MTTTVERDDRRAATDNATRCVSGRQIRARYSGGERATSVFAITTSQSNPSRPNGSRRCSTSRSIASTLSPNAASDEVEKDAGRQTFAGIEVIERPLQRIVPPLPPPRIGRGLRVADGAGAVKYLIFLFMLLSTVARTDDCKPDAPTKQSATSVCVT